MRKEACIPVVVDSSCGLQLTTYNREGDRVIDSEFFEDKASALRAKNTYLVKSWIYLAMGSVMGVGWGIAALDCLINSGEKPEIKMAGVVASFSAAVAGGIIALRADRGRKITNEQIAAVENFAIE